MLPPKLRIVDRLCAAVQQAGIRIDSDTVLIAVQHLLATNIALFDALFHLGLRPEKTFIIGKGYSTCVEVADSLRARGINVFPNNEPAPLGQFGEFFENELSVVREQVARRAQDRTVSRLLVLDDGGRLLSSYCKKPLFDIPTVGVEQTTSGIRRLPADHLRFPIVDVAQSAAKLSYESPLIAEAVLMKVAQLIRGFSTATNCGVVGLGSVGKALVSQLSRKGHRVAVAELPEFGNAAEVRKTMSFPEILAKCDLVFGCTGTNLFKQVSLPTALPSHVYLASCSSEDIEFAGLVANQPDFGKLREWPASSIEIESRGRHITLLRSGYPVNFDNSLESARTDDIQLTTSLVLAGER
jgi:S-adenosylhomocysteine hydrolase